MPPPPIWDSSRYRPATSRPGAVSGRVMAGFRSGGGSVGSDGGRDAEPSLVLLLGAGREGVVQRAELLERLGGEVVEDLLPGGRLVVAAGEQQLPRLRLPVPLAALGQYLGEVPVLGRVLLLAGRRCGQRIGVTALEDAHDRVDHFRPHLSLHAVGPAHVDPPRWLRARPEPFPGDRIPNHRGASCRTRTRRAQCRSGRRSSAGCAGTMPTLEDSPSGLWRSLGKRVGGNPSGVRISHPPQTGAHRRSSSHQRAHTRSAAPMSGPSSPSRAATTRGGVPWRTRINPARQAASSSSGAAASRSAPRPPRVTTSGSSAFTSPAMPRPSAVAAEATAARASASPRAITCRA